MALIELQRALPNLHFRLFAKLEALNPGETQELKFKAPAEEGVYPYVCTFTGHGVVMYGAMYVTTKPLPPLESLLVESGFRAGPRKLTLSA